MKNIILLTGGHAGSTAYALIQEIRKRESKREVVFVGSKNAIEGNNIKTLENTYLPKMGIRYIPILTGRLQRRFTKWTIPSLLKIPAGFIHALIILRNEKPSIVVSFGGYAAFPVVVMASIMKIPVIIHEQTASAGRANVFSGYFADKIALARKESEILFPSNKTIVVGNPISNEVSKCLKKNSDKKKNAIIISGGSRGSAAINKVVKVIIQKLIKKYKIYHQTGKTDYKEFKELKMLLDMKHPGKYVPFSTVEMWNWSKYLDGSDIAIARSGANFVAESIYLKMPSIFIPLPFSYKNEQYENALYAQKLGLAQIIAQKDLTPNILYQKIEEVSKNWDRIISKAKKPPIDDSKAAGKLYDLITRYAKKS